MLEVFDSKGKPKTYKVKNGKGEVIEKVEQQLLRKGDIVALPQEKITELGNSVSMVMAPVEMAPEEVTEETTEAEPEAVTKTVAKQIPKK